MVCSGAPKVKNMHLPCYSDEHRSFAVDLLFIKTRKSYRPLPIRPDQLDSR